LKKNKEYKKLGNLDCEFETKLLHIPMRNNTVVMRPTDRPSVL